MVKSQVSSRPCHLLACVVVLATGVVRDTRLAASANGPTVVRGGLDPGTIRQVTEGWKARGWSCKFAAPTVSVHLSTGEIAPRTIEVVATFRSPDGIVESYTITQTVADGATQGVTSWSGKRHWKLKASLYSGSQVQETEGQGDWNVVPDGDNGWLLNMGNGVGGVFRGVPFRLHGAGTSPTNAEPPGPPPGDGPLASFFPAAVRAVSGRACIYRRGQQLPVTKGSRIEKDDLLETGPEGRLIVSFGDDTARLTLSPNTKVNIEAYLRASLQAREEAGGFSLFRVLTGTVRFTCGVLFGEPDLHFRSSPGNTGGIRGTDLVLSSDPRTARDDLYVIDGVVDWFTPHGSRSVKTGRRLTWTRAGQLDVRLINPVALQQTGTLWTPPADVAATLPSLEIGNVWVMHNTHRTVPTWWEKGTAWEGQPAMTVYTQLRTRNLQGKKVSLQVTFENTDGSLLRWQRGAPPHCAGNDGVLRPWWGDTPPASPFEYRAFRIPVPYSAIDRSSIQRAGGKLKVKVKASRGAAYARGQTTIDRSNLPAP